MLLTYSSLNPYRFVVNSNKSLKLKLFLLLPRHCIWGLRSDDLGDEVHVSIFHNFLPDDIKELPPDLALHWASVDDNSMAVFFEIFWSFSFCSTRGRNLTPPVLQASRRVTTDSTPVHLKLTSMHMVNIYPSSPLHDVLSRRSSYYAAENARHSSKLRAPPSDPSLSFPVWPYHWPLYSQGPYNIREDYVDIQGKLSYLASFPNSHLSTILTMKIIQRIIN